MLLKHCFNIDQIQLKHSMDREGLQQAILKDQAIQLGLGINKHFPFIKNEELSYSGTLPEVAMNREHQFVDRYDLELCVLTMDERRQLLSLLAHNNITKPFYL